MSRENQIMVREGGGRPYATITRCRVLPSFNVFQQLLHDGVRDGLPSQRGQET